MSNTVSLREKHCSVAEQCRLKGDPIKKEAPIKALEVRRDEQHRHHLSLTSEVLSARDSLTPCSLWLVSDYQLRISNPDPISGCEINYFFLPPVSSFLEGISTTLLVSNEPRVAHRAKAQLIWVSLGIQRCSQQLGQNRTENFAQPQWCQSCLHRGTAKHP